MLVTVKELTDYMSNIELGESQTAAAGLVLSGTQNALENYLHRTLEQVHVREKIATNNAGEAITRYTPVQRVLSVKPINSTTVVPTVITPEVLTDVSAYTNADTLRVIDLQPSQHIIVPGGIYIGIPNTWYIVEYLAGGQQIAAPILDSIKLSILRVAAREMTANHDDTVGVKGDMTEQVDNAQPINKGWQEDELKMFDTLRRRLVRN